MRRLAALAGMGVGLTARPRIPQKKERVMNLSQLSPRARFALVVGASIGVGHFMIQAFLANLGPVVGLLAGVAGTIAIVETTYAVLAVTGAGAYKSAARSAKRPSTNSAVPVM
jgi:hypothetical protein